jgi:PhnB protein
MNTAQNIANAKVQPYLMFEGRTEEALAFYRKAIGAEQVMLSRFKEAPAGGQCPGADPEKVMHASFRVGDTLLMASDGNCSGKLGFSGISLSLTARDAAEAEKYFAALSEGGQVQMPLTETFFSPRFGMVADKFGVSWMIYVVPADQK